MNAAVLSIGTELTRGELVDTNGAWLCEQLTGLGFAVVEHAAVPDGRERIGDALRRLSSTARVVIATGGLGPTSDDLTSDAAATAAGVGLSRDDATLEAIRQKWRARGLDMPASNDKQADFPAGASILPNPVGTAPGFMIELGSCRAFFLPGVPSEMEHIFRETVVPAVAPLVERTTHQVHVRSFGLTESEVGERLRGLESEHEGVVLGYRASFPEIEIKVHATAAGAQEAEHMAEAVACIVRERLGDAAYGDRDDVFAGVVGQALRQRGLSLAVAESCTGGMIGAMITSVPGSSEYLLLDAVAYSNHSKSKMLGVNPEILRAHGAVSAETAVAMAEGAMRLADADVAVSVTGLAGPGGGTDDKPVGTVWFALAQKGRPTITKTRRLHGDRRRIQTLASYVALRMVKRAAEGRDPIEP